jgi:CubicO group peptidase (beta-lactamase class C family)
MTHPAFARVREVFADSLEAGQDLGGTVAVMVDGEMVVDLTGGWRDKQKTEPFGDTLVCIYSAGKAVAAALVARGLQSSDHDHETPVADIWPAFGAEGKDDLTVAEVLSHQGGVVGFPDETDPAIWLDWDRTTDRIAALAPLFPPRSASGYHPQTVGFVAGEIVRRLTGQTIGEQLRALDLDIHCGLAVDRQDRTGPMIKPPAAPDLGPITPLKRTAFLERWSSPAGVGREAWAAAEIPASNMHARADGLARLMQAFATGQVEGEAFLDAETRQAAIRPRIRGDDLVLPFDLAWAAGLEVNTHGFLGPSPSAVGHYGFGGACVVADPEHALSFAFVPNRMSPALVGDPRAINLLQAVYAAL